MAKDIREIVKEDLLEALGLEEETVPITEIEPEIKVSHDCITRALEELAEEAFIRREGELISLTDKGREKAKELIREHSTLQNYFAERRSMEEARKAAGLLEHYASREVIDSIRKLSTLQEGLPLPEINRSGGLITDIVCDGKLFERMISMGIYPGKSLKIKNTLPNCIVIELSNKKFALAPEIARNIKVSRDEET